jgi:hypothetical protein
MHMTKSDSRIEDGKDGYSVDYQIGPHGVYDVFELIQKPKQTKDRDCQRGEDTKGLSIVFNNVKKLRAEGPSFAQKS